MSTNLAVKVAVAVALIAQICETATLAPNSTTTATAKSTPTNSVTNEQIAGALAAALAGNGGSFGAYGDVILGMGDLAQAPRAGSLPSFNGARPNGQPWRPIPRPTAPMATAQFAKISGPGDALIYECYNSHLEYTSMSNSYIQNATGTRKYSTITESHSLYVTYYTNTTVPTKTRCDQWPRVLGPTVTPVTLTFTDSHAITKKEIYPGPAPTCKIADPECNVAYSAYDTATYSYLSSTFYKFFAEGKVGLPPNMYFGTLAPPCAAGGRIYTCPTATANASCTLNAAQATVFYWPAPTPASLDCRAPEDPKATTTEEETEEPTIYYQRSQIFDTPKTAIYGTATVTSPSALVVLRSISANAATKETKQNAYSNWQPCGNHLDATLAVPASALSTMRNSWTISYQNDQFTQYGSKKVPHSLAVADFLPGQVSYEAYAAAKNCNPSSTRGCPKTILDDYTPTLSLPSQATAVGVNSEFAVCVPSLVQNAVYIAITAATVTMPANTKYGMTVSTGPKETIIEPAVVAKYMSAEVTPAAEVEVD